MRPIVADEASMQHIVEYRRKALVVEERAVDRDLAISNLSHVDYEAYSVSSAADALAELSGPRL
jgi:CheY-like chemotaxis protein